MQGDYGLLVFAVPLFVIGLIVTLTAVLGDRAERRRSSKSHPAE